MPASNAAMLITSFWRCCCSLLADVCLAFSLGWCRWTLRANRSGERSTSLGSRISGDICGWIIPNEPAQRLCARGERTVAVVTASPRHSRAASRRSIDTVANATPRGRPVAWAVGFPFSRFHGRKQAMVFDMGAVEQKRLDRKSVV